jgi:hypothetical protein
MTIGIHGSVAFISTQPNLGKECDIATIGEGDTQVQMIVLDEAFVQLVREAVEGLTTRTSYYTFVSDVTVRLLVRLDRIISLPNVRLALAYMAENGEITLPALTGV